MLQRRGFVEKFVYEDSEGPDIGFGSINVVNKSLGAHVEGTANGDVPELRFGLDGKAKVAKEEEVSLEEDIGDLDIPVYDS